MESSKKRWSASEREAAVILVSCLAIATAVLGLLVYESTYPLCGIAPCPSRESLNLVSTTMTSPTSVTLRIVSTGPIAVSLQSYYAKDSNGQTYASNNWSGPNIGPNTIVSVDIIIDGRAFTFQPGAYYTVILVTSRNNQYTFTVST